MKVYVGQTRSRALIAELASLGYGEMTTVTEIPPRRRPFALDNDAYRVWTAAKKAVEAGKEPKTWSAAAFVECCSELFVGGLQPDFVVVPDQVAGGLASLHFSLAWVKYMRGFAPLYLAVQDGMDLVSVGAALPLFDGLFVGGTLEWKKASAPWWVKLAHEHQMPCHIGRVGGMGRVKWARKIGADSIDSCLPLFSKENLRAFRRGLEEAL